MSVPLVPHSHLIYLLSKEYSEYPHPLGHKDLLTKDV